MDKKDLFIKSKLQEDKNIPKDIDELIKNFKGGDIKMENNFNKSRKGKVAKIIAIAACFILVALVGVALLGQQNGQIIKVGGKDKVEGRKDLDIKDNNQSTAVKKVSFGKLDKILSNELFKGGNVASNNEIKSVIVNGITIYTNEYCEVQNMGYLSEEYKDKIVGYCVYTMEFENIQGLSLAGSKGEPYGTYENALLNGTTFVYNPETNNIEIGNELEFVKDKGNNGHNIHDIELDDTLGNVRFNNVYKKIYNDLATGGIVASNNKIKKIFINSITIYTDRYTQITGKSGEPKEIDTDVVGNYTFIMEFEDIEGLELAGGQGHIYGVIGNCLVNSNSFLYHQEEAPYEVKHYVETTETDVVNNNKDYSSIINEYKTAMNDANYSVETANEKYPNVNKNMMQHYHDDKFKVYYAKYDINKDKHDDLIIYADLGNSNYTIIDVFGKHTFSNGSYDIVKVIYEDTLGERSRLDIFDNGIMYLTGSGGALSGILEFAWMTPNTDHVGEGRRYIYEFDDNNNITIYEDDGRKNKLDYSSIDEVVKEYKKDAKVIQAKDLNLIEIK